MNENALAVNGLTKQYKDFTLDGVSFAVPCGTIVGLVGENGAGKSTTMNAILGLIQKDAGTIEIFGKQDAPGRAHGTAVEQYLQEAL